MTRSPSPFAELVRVQCRLKELHELEAKPKPRAYPWWQQNMAMGSPVTTDAQPYVSQQDQMIARLLQGPAPRSELAPESRNFGATLREVNKSLKRSHWRVVSRVVTTRSAHGLRLKVRMYAMVRT